MRTRRMTEVNFQTPDTEERNPFTIIWKKFSQFDSFTKGIIIAMLCILIATPVIISTRQQTKNFAAEPTQSKHDVKKFLQCCGEDEVRKAAIYKLGHMVFGLNSNFDQV